jgi:hypothetical protein
LDRCDYRSRLVELVPGTVFAGHRIEQVAGRGGMGVVYKATHLALEITVALKVIAPEMAEDEDFRARFKRESRLAAQVEHPHLIPVRHAGEEDGQLYVTMRYVEGTDLRRMIAEQGRLEAGLVATVVSQVAEGLSAAHDAGLVHRDVKPANILVDRGDSGVCAYLTDFGLTRRQAGSDRLTRTGRWMGTIDYVAPEQIQGADVDGRTDVYSLGCVLFHALCGEVPYPRETEVAKMYAHLNEPPPSVAAYRPDLPRAIDPVIRHAMANDPAERYPTASELGSDLVEVLRAEATAPTMAPTAPPSPPPEPAETRPLETEAVPAPPGRRRRLGPVLALGGVLAAVAAAIALLAGGGDGGETPAPAPPDRAASAALVAFRSEADRICTGIERGVEQASAEVASPAEFLGERAAIVREGVGRLRQLDVPDAQSETFGRYVEARERFAGLLDDLGSAIESGDTAAQAEVQQQIDATVRRKMELGRRLGMDACGDVLPARDRRRVRALASGWLTGADRARTCSDAVTATFLDAEYDGDEGACAASPPLASKARFADLFGVAGVHATSTFETDAGTVQVDTDYEDGRWKVDGVKPTGA